jgi:hypothetical protein
MEFALAVGIVGDQIQAGLAARNPGYCGSADTFLLQLGGDSVGEYVIASRVR